MCNNILVTGGAGFIGSYLCEQLLSEGNSVVCLDDFSTGSRNNLIAVANHPNFSIIQNNVKNNIEGQYDMIYNLACVTSPIQYRINPVQTFETSVLGAMSVLETARVNRAKVLQASTSDVYGDSSVNPQREDYWGNVNPVGMRSCYDEGKRSAETLFMDYRNKFGTRVKIARIFNTFGPRMGFADGRVIPNFIIQALRNDDITIYGDGGQTRSFQYVDDLVGGLIRLMNTDDSFTGPVNLGNPRTYTILELADKILSLTESKSRIVFEMLPRDDPRHSQPDTTLARSAVGYRPEENIDRGLIKTIEFFKKIMNF